MKLISTKSIFTTLLLFVGLCNSVFAADGDVILSETFSKCTFTSELGTDGTYAQASGSDITSSSDTYTDNPGWTFVKAYQASGAIKMGTSKVAGEAETPALVGLTAASGNATVVFYAVPWTTDAVGLTLSLVGDGTLDKTQVDMKAAALTKFTVSITGGTDATKLHIASAKRWFITELTVTAGLPAAAAVEAPAFSIAGGTYDQAQSVAITSATDGASIYYTVDGTTPTAESTPYTTPLELSSTTTLKAIAVKGTDVSEITETSYVFSKVVTSLADLLAQSVGEATPFILTISESNPVTILAHSGTNYYLQQGEANVWMYYNGTELTEATSNMTVTGTITGTLTTYYGQTEFNVSSVTNVGGGDVVTVTPIAVDVTDFAANPSKYLFKLVTLTDYHFDADYQFVVTTAKSTSGKVGDVPIVCYSQFNNLTKSVDLNHAYTITGIAGSYYADLQIYPLSDDGIVATAALLSAPTFTPAEGAYTGEVSVTIANPDGKGSIYYTTDGTDPTTASAVYSNAIKLTETTTIKALVVNGEDQSAIVSSTYTIIPAVSTLSELKAFAGATNVPVALVVTTENPVTIASLYSQSAYQFLEQNGEYICSYDSKVLPVVTTEGFQSGATFSGTIFGVVKVYNRMVEFVPDSVKDIVIVGSKTLTPTVVGYGDFVENDSAYAGKLITLEGMFPTKDYTYVDAATGSVTLTNSESDKNVSFYNAFKLTGIGSVYATKKYNITGFVTVAKTSRSVLPRTISDIVANTVGIDKVAADQLKIVSGTGQVVFTAISNEIVTVTDLTGAQVAKVSVTEGENTINLPAGIYVIKGQKVVVF